MATREQIINTIKSATTNAEAEGKVEIILPWETETIFTTKGLDNIMPLEAEKVSKYFRTGHNIVYDIYIDEEDRFPAKISFLAMFTELSREPENIAKRNYILQISGRAPSDKNYVRINLMEKLTVTEDDDFLETLKKKVSYFIDIAIPAFEKNIY